MKTTLTFFVALILATALHITGTALHLPGSAVHAQPMQNYLDEPPIERDLRMEWWRDARFGMFIHWGLYAIPAGEWGGEQIDGIGEWIMAYANIPVEDYEPLADEFNPVEFDATEWCRIAKDAGQEYLVITSKHHDGFAIFDSEVSDYDIVDSTPYGQDVLAPLADACREAGVELGFYYSILDWHHPSQFVDYEAEDPQAEHANNSIHPEQKEEYVSYMKAQIRELVDQYDPTILWFDGEWVDWWTEEDGKDMYNYVRSLKEDILINNRVGKGRDGMAGLSTGPDYAGDFGTPEQEIPDTGLPGVDWETCMTMNDTWGYKAADDNWKSSEELIHNLIDAASKGGNYLLNVGPKADGTIPEESVERLAEMGEWMDVYGESIYMTKASPFGQPDWGRYTRRDPTVLYAHVFDWPQARRIEIPAVPIEVTGASLMTRDDPITLNVQQSANGITVLLPADAPETAASVVKVEFADKW